MTDFADLLNINVENGELIVGISTGIDAALKESEKLRVKANCGNWRELIEFALSHIPVNENELIETLICSGVCAIFLYGAVNVKSIDVRVINNMTPGTHKHVIDLDVIRVRNAMSVICATKINFFTTNHHTGQGKMTGYPLKVFNSLYNTQLEIDITSEITKTIHMIGHWADTRFILNKFGITGIRQTETLKGRFNLKLSEEFKLRSSVMPAGTAGLALCYAIVKRLKNTRLKYAIEDVTIFERIHKAYHIVMENRAAYHMSARYLTGRDKLEYNDNEFTNLLGLLGSFINNIYPSSSICKSPKIKKGERLIYKEYEEYSEAFEALCVSVKKAIGTGVIGEIENYLPAVITSSADREETVNEIFSRLKFV